MMTTGVRRALLTGSAAIGLTGAMTGAAHAQAVGPAGTGAGTRIENVASASYTVNGTPQSATSNVAAFVVDRKVNLTVVSNETANVQVNLSQPDAVLSFQVTNNTNATQDFILNAEQAISLGILNGTDNFDATNVRVFVDSNGNRQYDAGVDTATFIDELPADGSATVFIVGTIPNQSNAALAFLTLRATVATGGTGGTLGAALIPTPLNTINQDAEVDVVFVDNDSDGLTVLGDIARNGQGVAYAAYEVGTRNVALTIAKSSRVISDGFNALNPKAIPGAVVEYCLVVSNATLGTPATNVVLSDVVPAATTYVPGSLQVGILGAATACVVPDGAEDDDADDAAETDAYRASYTTGNRTVASTITSLPGGGSVATHFRVTIN